jgi:hypothetical protein
VSDREPADAASTAAEVREEVASRAAARRARAVLDWVLSASTGAVALGALGVSAYQTYLTRQQAKVSAWPYVTQGNTGNPLAEQGFARLVLNAGLGPALVRSMRIEIDGRAAANWREVFLRGLRTDSARFVTRFGVTTRTITSTIARGTVLLPGTTTEIIRIPGSPFGAAVRDLLNDSRTRIRVCYCSLYDDCWWSDSLDVEPKPVEACPADDARAFSG